MPKKKLNSKQIEQKEFRIFNPEDIKQAVEIPVKPALNAEDLETIEFIGKKEIKKTKAKRTKKISIKDEDNIEEDLNADKSAKLKTIKLNPKGYTLIITEKPQAAAKIASALANGNERKRLELGVAYYELERNRKRIVVACTVGHLFTVSQTKKGSQYPIFDIAWFPNFEIKKNDFTKKYYFAIKKLVKNASDITIATDFDIEGEVIGYNIVKFIAGQKDANRMKFSSLTTKELQDSYDKKNPTIEWGQAIAGETRHFIDWLYGINLSRALMNSIKSTGKFKIMSIGRVQGPALNLIVQKEKEILNFKSMPYWQIFITINDGKNKIDLKYIKDITKKQDLDKFKDLEGKKAIAKTIKKKESIQPPAPFDLTSLQTEVYHNYSITPSQTLQIAQKLYLAGLISYPRTSSQKIPEAMMPKKILEQLSKHFKETSYATRKTPVEGKKSDPAHPAIVPVGTFEKLDGDDEKVYNLIVKRFISCFCNNAEIENKKVEAEINISEMQISDDAQESKNKNKIPDNLKFNEKGMEILESGWMNVYPAKINEKEIKDFNGEVNIDKTRFEEKMTQPPRRYSPASIVTELEKRNLGTKATRANIIETLYDRNYVQGKSIQATELGIKLIDSLKKHSPIIIDEHLTREMEKDMENIRSSKKELEKKENAAIKKAEDILTRISKDFKKNEKEIGNDLVNASEDMWEQQKENSKLGIKCPKCEKGELLIKYTPRFKNYFVACTNYPECRQTFSLPSKALIKKLDDNKKCEYCQWPMLISIKKGKRPWIFCFNPLCESKKELDINGNTKNERK